MTTLHPIFQQALAPFTRHLAPIEPKKITEADLVAADLANNRDKPAQHKAHALAEQIKHREVI